MLKLKKYDITGKEIGDVELSEKLFAKKISSQSLKDYIVAIRRNARQWSANTKGRSEVSCSTKKPHAQKGTGRARQGTIVAPQYRGGGIVFGPKPKFDQFVKINKKERRSVICHLVKEKIDQGKFLVLQPGDFTEPKTKKVFDFLKKLQMDGKRILFLKNANESADSHFSKSVRNVPKVELGTANTLNAYTLMKANFIIALDSAIESVTTQLEVMSS